MSLRPTRRLRIVAPTRRVVAAEVYLEWPLEKTLVVDGSTGDET